MTTPDDWLGQIARADFSAMSANEIAQLRAAVAQSEELQQALRDRLGFEEVLSGELARPVISGDDITIRSRRRGPSVATMLVVAISLAVAAVIGWNSYFRPVTPADDPVEVTEGPKQPAADLAPDGKPPAETHADRKEDEPPTATDPHVPVVENDASAEPWSSDSQLGAAPVAWSSLAWRPIASPSMTGKVLRTWFAPLHDEAATFPEEKVAGPISGTFQLLAPWPEDAAFRLRATFDEPVQLIVASDEQAITLQYHPELNPTTAWVAYLSDGLGAPEQHRLPAPLQLAASDYGKFWRWQQGNPATITLRRDRQRLSLSIGDAVMLTAPLGFEPTHVLVDGALDNKALELVPFIDDQSEQNSDTTRPIALSNWQAAPAESLTLAEGDNQAILTGDQPAKAWAAFRPQGWTPWFVEIEAAAGVSFYLGDADGEPIHEFRVLRDPGTRANWIGHVESDVDSVQQIPDTGEFPVAWVHRQFFLRPRLAGRFVWCDISVDGRHWAPIGPPRQMFDAYQVRTIGLANLGGGVARISLRLHQAEPTGGELAADAVELAIAPDVTSYEAWLAAVDQARPAQADADAWRRACVEQFTAGDFQPTLNHRLLARLFEDEFQNGRMARSRQDIEQQLDRLDEFAFRIGPWQPLASPVDWDVIRAAYRHLAEQWVRLGETTPFSAVGRRLLASPAWFETAEDFWLNESAVWQLAAMVESSDWPGVQQTDNVLRYCEDSLALKNSLWAANVRHEADPSAAQENVEPIALDWHHPLHIRVGREDFDLLSNLRSLVNGGQFDDACRLIAGSERLTGQGVAASPDDPRLWVSLPLAIDRMFRRHPELGETMRTAYSTLAEARLRKAHADGDAAAMLDVSRRFPTTTAAAEADVWLGNHHLALGEFRSALDHYRRAEASRAIDASNEFASRVRLASAMLGTDAGGPVRQAVEFHSETLSAAEFESLLAELRDRHRLANRTAEARTAFSPSPLHVATLGGAVATEAIGEIPPPLDYRAEGIAAASSELAIAEHGGAVFVSNRYGVAAFDGEGRRRWEATLGDRAGRANVWPLVRMQPVLAGRRLLARLITQQGPQLFAIDAASGQLLWQARIEAEAEVVSDPVIIGDEALVLVAAGRGREQQISLARFDLASGDRLASAPVMRLAAGWLQYGQARLAAREDALYAVLGGAVARVQFDGRLDWMRRQNWRPPELIPQWYHQLAPSITFHEDLVVVAQPGVETIEGIEIDTGQRRWHHADPTLLGVVGAANAQLVARNRHGFFTLAASDGKPRKRLATDVAGDGHYLDDWSTLFYFRRAPTPPHSLQAWWWDASEGKLLGGDPLVFDGQTDLDNLVIAPLAVARGRMIAGAAPTGDVQPAAILALFRQAGSPELRPPPERNPWTPRTVLTRNE